MSSEAVQRATQVKRKHEGELMRKANVVAVGVGFGSRQGQRLSEPCIVVSVTHKVPTAQLNPKDVIPQALEGVPVDVVETGEIRAQ